jgi:cell division cycle 14
MSAAAEVIPGRLYLVACDEQHAGAPPGVPPRALCYWLDHDLVYEPFCADFGPCNLAHTWRFCARVNALLAQAEAAGRPAYLLVGPHPHRRANAAALVGVHSVLFLGKRAEEAYAPLRALEPFAPFRDASSGPATHALAVADVVRGAARARDVGFMRWAEPGAGGFDLEEYEHYEQVENGDLNWIVPGKLLAFAGPSATARHYGGWRTFTPEDYVPYFRSRGVTRAVRLNKRMYEASRFTAHGVAHTDMYFPDGTCPPEPILYRFLEIAEREPGALAVHCKAGLGRTGVLICAYMIKHFSFTAEEAMGYIRLCRPGSVLGPQQHYLLQYAPRLLHEGRVGREAGMAAAHLRADGALARGALGAKRPASGGVIHLTASARAADLDAARPRRSPRLGDREEGGGGDEPAGMVCVPAGHAAAAASPAKGGGAAPTAVHCHARAASSGSDAASNTSMDLDALVGGGSGAATPAATRAARAAPPSSTKRLLAPNGQPRKIPLAMDFDAVADAGLLEDREAADLGPHGGDGGLTPLGDGADDWRVGATPARPDERPRAGVGAFVGRGASAFVDAFRSVVGAHRSDYAGARR